MSLVSFVKARSHHHAAVREAIENSMNLIKFSFERNIVRIVIKPNMCYYYHPSTGEVTDPRFLGALIDALRTNYGNSCEIFLVESDASAMKCRHAFRMLGYNRLAEQKSVELINLSEVKSRIVEVKVRDERFKFHVPELFYKSDLIVNVPKLKYMNGVGITCSLKNMFGCNAYARKFIYHRALDEAIVGINKLIRTSLVVVDGLIVRGKHTKRLGLVMASRDPVAVDAAASELMGICIKSVSHINVASSEGVGTRVFIPVGDFSHFKKEFPKKSLKDTMRQGVAALYLRAFQK